jgi:hypothetical protein
VEVLVGGATAATLPSPDKTKPSVVVEYDWQPPSPGAYTLQARGQNTAGTWGAFAQLSLTITEPLPTETSTSQPTETPTLAPTETPTDVVSTSSPTFTLNPLETTSLPPIPGLSFTWEFSSYRMYRYGSACEPQQNGVFVYVSGIDLNTVAGVMIFFQPTDENNGNRWTWSPGLWLERYEGGVFARGFSTAHMVRKGQNFPYIPALVRYQFVMTDKMGANIYYSEIRQNLEVAPCR